MRTAGICSVHQSLSQEAITIVKQAINLARRRGHAQVTPIHVATVMLASPAGLLRSACLKSSLNSHPYQCKALELCFNVALNRLPATTSSPLLAPHNHSHHYPALANALMAAFKRAQAHQRRGSIEAQQQPILALKIETEQLVISILDDPSVSRVMREAGFSSTLLKSYVEQSLSSTSLEVSSQTTTTNTTTTNNNSINVCGFKPLVNPFELGFSKPYSQEVKSEDVSSVIDAWVRRREKSSVVVVGECLGSCEGVVRAVKERVERGDNIPMELKYVQFLNCPLLSMRNLSREEIDMKLGEIRCLLKGCVGRGVVLYLGDLKWVAEYWAYYKNGDQQKRHNYCPVEHLIMGLRRLVFGNVENNGRVWLMGISTFNTLIKCKSGNPSLETLLDLHSLTIPSASLDLTLNLESKKSSTSTNSRLPFWLQKCKEESRELSPHDDHQEESSVQKKELCKKRNFPEKTINFTMSCSPTSSNSMSSYEHDDNYCKPTISTWPASMIFEPQWSTKLEEHQFLSLPINQKPELLSNPNSIPNSASSSQATEPVEVAHYERFKENNPEDLEALCSELEKKVPWQKDIIPEIATTILRCRSRKVKQETWLFFLGADEEGKLKLAQELAKLVFGISSFKSIGLGDLFSSSSSSTRADDDHCSKKKRGRDDGFVERLAHAVRENPHRVFYVEDVEQMDKGSLKCIKTAIETGKFVLSDGERVPLEDAIVIFSCDSFSTASRACSPPVRQKLEEENDGEERENDFEDDDEACSSLPLDLNIAVNKQSVGGIRILDAVDKQIFFRNQVNFAG